MKTMINRFCLMCLLCLAGVLQVSAQAGNPPDGKGDDKREKIEALKVAYISQQINLTTAEAEKFWPLYNEFNDKREEYAKVKKQLERDARETGMDKITDKQAEDLLNAELKFEQQVLDLKKEYLEKYKAIIGIKKTAKFFHAEREFNDFLLQQLKGGGERKPPPPPKD